MSLWEYANPLKFLLALSDRVLPWVSVLSGVCLVVGLIWGFFFTPEDYRMGSTVKIIYIHVPSALMAINAWFMMLVASLIWLIRRHHVSACSKGCGTSGIGNDIDRPYHRRVLGTADVGHVVGLGPKADLFPYSMPILYWLHCALEGD